MELVKAVLGLEGKIIILMIATMDGSNRSAIAIPMLVILQVKLSIHPVMLIARYIFIKARRAAVLRT